MRPMQVLWPHFLPKMPHYSQQQHTSLHMSTDRRKHLNLLLYDQLDEINRIYPEVGRKPTYTLSPTRQRLRGTGQTNATGTSSPTYPVEFNNPNGLSAHAHRTHTGTRGQQITAFPDDPSQQAQHHYLADGGYPSEPASPAYVPPASEAIGLEPVPVPQLAPAPTAPPSRPVGTQLPQQAAPWLMPWQTGDREMGRKMADMIRSKRTPVGAFANLDLAKAAK